MEGTATSGRALSEVDLVSASRRRCPGGNPQTIEKDVELWHHGCSVRIVLLGVTPCLGRTTVPVVAPYRLDAFF
jgi:hypothetical protein